MSKLRICIAAVGILAAVGAVGIVYRWTSEVRAGTAEDSDKPREQAEDRESDNETAVRKTAAEFARAFAKKDAKAIASLWIKDGEYVGPDGEPVRGRDAIEKLYAAFFKDNPRATVEVRIESVKLLGRHAAVERGTLRGKLSDETPSVVSEYSVLHVRDGNVWRMASVREWVPDPARLITLKDIEWLIGEWTAKVKDDEASMTYAWDEDRTYIHARYTMKHEGKVSASGTQIIGKDPAGGLRSWQFDRSGATGEWTWTRDENGWVIETAGVLPDGSAVSAINLLVPLGKDAFTWQSVERMVAGAELPDTPPLKVTRVKTKK